MPPELETTEFRKILEALRDICVEHLTGTGIVTTEDSHQAKIGIDKGRVVSIQFCNKSGIEALRLLRQVDRAAYSFHAGEKPQETSASEGSTAYLPSTFHVFAFLGLDSEAAAPLKQMAGGTVSPNAKRPVTPPAQGTKKKILVVEDSAISRKVISRTLLEGSYEIVETEDGFQALAALGNSIPDLVLLDLVLPGIDGYKVLTHMRKKAEFAKIPVIILTSRDTLLDKLRGKMSEADEYLTKPFAPHELLEKVEKHLEK